MSNSIVAPQRKSQLDLLAVSLLLACCLFWGFQQVLVKATLNEIPPFFQAGVRFLGAALVIWAWCQIRGIKLTEKDGTFWPGMLAGLCFAAEFVCIYLGLTMMPASRLTIFLYCAQFWVAFLLPFVVKSEKLNAYQWGGLVLAFIGVVVAVQGNTTPTSSHGAPQQILWLGDFLAILAGLFWGLSTVIIRGSNLVKIAPEKNLLYQVGLTAVLMLVGSSLLGESQSISHWSGFAWTSLALQIVVGAFLTYLTWMWLLTRYPATKLGSFTFLAPVFALFIGAIWQSEPVTMTLVVALALVAVGIVLVNRK